MTRQALSDGTFFETDTATKWEEETRWDGRNHISLATGYQWDHEELYLTEKGNWILHHWSDYQGTTPSYEVITPEAAARWLIRNNEDLPEPLAEFAEQLEL